MGILNNLLSKVQGVDEGLRTGEIVRNALVKHPDDILELQRIQLFEGKASSGKDIRPYYSEDLKPSGYFYSVESAGRYADWKQSLNYPYEVNRNPDAPNLYIVGKFHDELGVEFTTDTVGVVPTTAFASKIVSKYGMETFGLTVSNWNIVFEERGAYNDMMDELRQRLYGN